MGTAEQDLLEHSGLDDLAVLAVALLSLVVLIGVGSAT